MFEMTNENFARLLNGLTIAVGNRKNRILFYQFLAAEMRALHYSYGVGDSESYKRALTFLEKCEVFRYQIVGPPNFGLTNLRTVQDWVVIRRLFTVPGVVQVTSWGGPTKQYDVEVDLHKLDAYNVTLPQVIGALGSANINVGGREITVGQQSVNIRGVGLFDSGGAEDLTQGWHVNDIEDVVLTQVNGVPVHVNQVAKVSFLAAALLLLEIRVQRFNETVM